MSFQLLPKKLPPTQWLKNTRLLVHSSVGQKPGGLDHVLCIGSHEVRINVLARLCSYWRFCRIDFQSYLVIGRTRFYVIIVLRSPFSSWLLAGDHPQLPETTSWAVPMASYIFKPEWNPCASCLCNLPFCLQRAHVIRVDLTSDMQMTPPLWRKVKRN